jgi:hypothetical protein
MIIIIITRVTCPKRTKGRKKLRKKKKGKEDEKDAMCSVV